MRLCLPCVLLSHGVGLQQCALPLESSESRPGRLRESDRRKRRTDKAQLPSGQRHQSWGHSGILQQPHPQQQLFGGGSRWHEFRVLSSTRPSGSSAIELSLGRILDVAKSNSAAPARCRTARDRRGNAEPTRMAMSAALS